MRYLFLVLMGLLTAVPARAQTADSSGTLVVVVTGFESEAGDARVRLDASKAAYEAAGDASEAAPFTRATTAAIDAGTATWVVDGLAFGTYAVSAFHDEDGDGTLDTNVVGMPTEPYGFSNEARARFSRPRFDEAAFRFATPRDTVRVRVR